MIENEIKRVKEREGEKGREREGGGGEKGRGKERKGEKGGEKSGKTRFLYTSAACAVYRIKGLDSIDGVCVRESKRV